MKRVAFVVTTIDSGGLENYLLRFLKFSKYKLEPIVICKSGKFGELKSEFEEIHGIDLIALEIGYFNLNSYYKLYKLFKCKNVDSICDFTGNFAGLILLIARLAKINCRIAFYRGSTNHFTNSFFKNLYNKLLNRITHCCSTKILSNSKAALDYFYPTWYKSLEKYEVVYNGINFSDFNSIRNVNNLRFELNIPASSFVIGHVGRFDVSKNHKVIFQVALSICRANKSIYFILCGKGTENLLDHFSVQELDIRSRIICLGYRRDVYNVLKALDVFYFPSLTEGQPNSLIEAMISGIPIVASNISSIKESVPECLHMYLKEPNDITGQIELLEKMYKKIIPSMDISEWARAQFDANAMFIKFYRNL